MPNSLRVDEGPVNFEGVVARIVTDGRMAWVETWDGNSWVRSNSVTVRDVMVSPPISPEALARAGINRS